MSFIKKLARAMRPPGIMPQPMMMRHLQHGAQLMSRAVQTAPGHCWPRWQAISSRKHRQAGHCKNSQPTHPSGRWLTR